MLSSAMALTLVRITFCETAPAPATATPTPPIPTPTRTRVQIDPGVGECRTIVERHGCQPARVGRGRVGRVTSFIAVEDGQERGIAKPIELAANDVLRPLRGDRPWIGRDPVQSPAKARRADSVGALREHAVHCGVTAPAQRPVHEESIVHCVPPSGGAATSRGPKVHQTALEYLVRRGADDGPAGSGGVSSGTAA
jgi:hypothetical protein